MKNLTELKYDEDYHAIRSSNFNSKAITILHPDYLAGCVKFKLCPKPEGFYKNAINIEIDFKKLQVLKSIYLPFVFNKNVIIIWKF